MELSEYFLWNSCILFFLICNQREAASHFWVWTVHNIYIPTYTRTCMLRWLLVCSSFANRYWRWRLWRRYFPKLDSKMWRSFFVLYVAMIYILFSYSFSNTKPLFMLTPKYVYREWVSVYVCCWLCILFYRATIYMHDCMQLVVTNWCMMYSYVLRCRTLMHCTLQFAIVVPLVWWNY